MKLRWTRLALANFERAHDHIAHDNLETARLVAAREVDGPAVTTGVVAVGVIAIVRAVAITANVGIRVDVVDRIKFLVPLRSWRFVR